MKIPTLLAIMVFWVFVDPSMGDQGMQRKTGDNPEAWAAWKKGNIPKASALAAKIQGDEGNHLRFLTASVRGRYEEAIGHYQKIDPSYQGLSDLDNPVVDAYKHLRKFAEAKTFARRRKMKAEVIRHLGQLAKKPLRASLDTVSVVPFASHMLTAFFPAFSVEIDGQAVTAHLDTGGTYLIMGPGRAEDLGIKLTEAGEGFHGARKVPLKGGIAKQFKVGDAVFENIPVVVMPTLVGPQNFIIFGTNILEPFLSTMDYAKQRLILSPRGDPKATKKHLDMLPASRKEVPFYMWGDHYMFARGGVGDHQDLNFFVDSGLVSIHPDPKGGMRQAAFTASAERFLDWGIPEEDVNKGVFESHLPLSLGGLQQEEQLFLVGPKSGYGQFGGVRVDGLISHAWLKNYAWTLDFDRHVYIFSGLGNEALER